MKIFLNLLLIFLLAFYPNSISYGNISETQQGQIDSRFLGIQEKIGHHTEQHQKVIYKYLREKIEEKLTSKNRELIHYIVRKLNTQIDKLVFIAHKSLILHFSAGGDHISVLSGKQEFIKTQNSVFIFRSGKQNLSAQEIKTITSTILSYNKESMIFIDQEGGSVNRYRDFSNNDELQSLFEDHYIELQYALLSKEEQKIFKTLFLNTSGYFPSLKSIGVAFDSFSSEQSQKIFLDTIAYMRLKSLKNNGINTYGLVADLNRGNPAVSYNGRSFSQHSYKYRFLIDAFIGASEQTGVLLYLKHFPGHGAGIIDSHKGTLDLRDNGEYLQENMELFEYFLDNKKGKGGIMVGHMLIADSLYEPFKRIVEKTDFIVTDDLAMQGYKQAKNSIFTHAFFSTNEVLTSDKLIQVDTQYVENVY